MKEFVKWIVEQHGSRKANREQCIERIEMEFAQKAWQACAELKEEEIAKLKQERDELAAQAGVMRDALTRAVTAFEGEIHNEYDGTSMLDDRLAEVDFAREALSLTPSAALREIQARTLEELKHAYTSYMTANLLSGLHWNDIEAIADEMAAAKRKGE